MSTGATFGTGGATGGAPGGDTGGMGSASTGGDVAGAGGDATGGTGGTVAPQDSFACNPGTEGNGISEQPGPYERPPEAYPSAEVPQGTLTPLTPFASTIYDGHEFGHQVYVPAQYDPNQPAALVVYQDASHYTGVTDAKFYAQHVMDHLIAAGEMPVSIALFVDVCMTACEPKRVEIYDAPTDKYSRFLREEIIPQAITSKYNIVMDPDAWATIGFSAGAMQGFHAAWYQPDLFHKVIGHNTSFPASSDHGVDYSSLIPANEKRDLRVALLSGTMDLSDHRGNWLEVNTAIAQAMLDKGYDVRMRSGTGGHYPPDQAAADFPDALRWLFRGCSFQTVAP